MVRGAVLRPAVALLAAPGRLPLALLAAFAFVTAHMEEDHNLQRFGQAYLEYRLRTKMFIPFLV